ncbi:hypothetical protein K469DRAFT_524217, partial [Zopfia rhizophila CBS 207.26]
GFSLTAAGRRLFLTRQGEIGFGPPEMKPGDCVYILHGGNMPSIIRSTRAEMDHTGSVDGRKQEPVYGILIGDCYLDGVMFGE